MQSPNSQKQDHYYDECFKHSKCNYVWSSPMPLFMKWPSTSFAPLILIWPQVLTTSFVGSVTPSRGVHYAICSYGCYIGVDRGVSCC